MREARLICPLLKSGKINTCFHEKLEAYLCRAWDGFTRLSIKGAWRDNSTGRDVHEPMIAYDIAMVVSEDNRRLLECLAAIIQSEFGETCVYVRFPDGTVRMVSRDTISE